MVTLPALTAVASPVPLTAATAVLLLDQVTDWPVRTLPLASKTVAVN